MWAASPTPTREGGNLHPRTTRTGRSWRRGFAGKKQEGHPLSRHWQVNVDGGLVGRYSDAERVRPLPRRSIFDVAETEGEAVVEPDGVADNRGREPIAWIVRPYCPITQPTSIHSELTRAVIDVSSRRV